jgi:Cytochrome domain of cellobiose dehydrogenase
MAAEPRAGTVSAVTKMERKYPSRIRLKKLLSEMILATAALIALVSAQQSYQSHCDGQRYCLYAGPSADGKSTVFTAHCAAAGWCGVGVGSGMTTASLYVAWQNSTKGHTLVSTKAKSFSMPTTVSPQDVRLIPLQVKAPAWAKLAFSFIRSSSGITPSSTYLLAMANNPPSVNIDSIDASYGFHNAGDFKFAHDFTKLIPAGTNAIRLTNTISAWRTTVVATPTAAVSPAAPTATESSISGAFMTLPLSIFSTLAFFALL